MNVFDEMLYVSLINAASAATEQAKVQLAEGNEGKAVTYAWISNLLLFICKTLRGDLEN